MASSSCSCLVSGWPRRSVLVIDIAPRRLVSGNGTGIDQAFGLEFKARQRAIVGALDVEASAFVRLGQIFGEPLLKLCPFAFKAGLDVELDGDFIRQVILAPDVN